MKTIKNGEEFEVDAEVELDKYFPKGDDRRGQAILILATAKLEERERILKLIDKMCRKHFVKDFMIEALKQKIKEGEK